MRCTGSRCRRREIQASYRDASSSVNGSSRTASPARPTPSNSERRTSAEAVGSGTPARSSLVAARRAVSLAPSFGIVLARGSRRFGSELVRPLLGGERPRELFEVTAEGGLEVVGGDADAVVGYAPLREVVGADLGRAVARADLGLPQGALLLGPLAHLALQQARLQYPHGLLLVLELALLVLAGDDQAGGLVRDPDRRVRRVHALPTGAAGTVDVDLQVSGVDLDLHVLGLGQNGHRGRRSMDAALALGFRNPLHPVRAALVLQDGVGPVAANLYGDFFVATDLGGTRR